MILNINNINVSFEEIKRNIIYDDIGASAYDIIKFANKKGLNAEGYKNMDLNKLKNPCIVHTINEDQTQHFVVFLKEYKNKVLIADPAKKIMFVDKKHFLNKYTKIAIIFKNELSFKDMLFSNKKRIVGIIFLTFSLILLSFIFSSFLPLILKFYNNKKFLFIIFTVFILVCILKNITSYIKNKLFISFQIKTDSMITLKTINKLINLPQHYYQNKASGELISKVNDLSYIKDALFNFIGVIIINIFFIILCLIIISLINPMYGIINLIFLIIIFYQNKKFYNLNLSLSYDMQIANENFNSKLSDILNSINILKNLCKESFFKNKIYSWYNNLLSKYKKLISKYNSLELKNNLFIDLYNLIIVFLSFYFYNNLPMILFIISTQNILIDLINETTKNIPLYLDFKSSYIRIKDIYNNKDIIYEDSKLNITHIKIKNLSYKYNDKLVLKNINLEINKGDWILINGKSGGGKSTLFKILTMQLPFNKKNIYINNKNINEIDDKEIKNSILYIDQKQKLFSSSLKENIFFDSKVDNEILKVTKIDEMLKEKNITLDYEVNVNNSNLSGGEISKILIAQALNLNKKIIILDETTNNFDKETELEILKNIKNKYNDLIFILISHKENLKHLFNKVYTLENGNLKLIKGGQYEINK